MNLREYLGDKMIEDYITKQFQRSVDASDLRFFSREEAEQFVTFAFLYVEKNGLTEKLLEFDKRTICQLLYRIAARPADAYIWQVQMDLGLAGKFETPDGAIYFYTHEGENLGDRRGNLAVAVEISKRRGTSPLW
jgi:hypothetical protein